MSSFGRILGLVSALVAFGFSGGEARAEGTEVSGRIGRARYSKSVPDRSHQGLSTTYSFEVTQYLKLDRALFFGYMNYPDPSSKRDAYQAAFAGFRYFPFSIGRPVEDSVQETHVSFDSLFKFYVDAGVTFGRCYFEPTGNNYGDLSADTNGVIGGVGLAFFPTNNIDFKVSVSQEIFQARGGTADSLNLSGNNRFAIMGLGFML